MHSKPLSSEQALDDYFFDLLGDEQDVASVNHRSTDVVAPEPHITDSVHPAVSLWDEPAIADPPHHNVERLLQQVSSQTVSDDSVALKPFIQQVSQSSQPVVTVANSDVSPQPEAMPDTAMSALIPPETWNHHGMEHAFQALYFEVHGVMFAVALTELGGIHQLGELNRLLGRPAWYLGLQSDSRAQQFDVVDTARWVMPEKLSNDEYKEQYRYVVMLGESQWGLACDQLHGTTVLEVDDIRWREKAGKRPWLAGMVKDKMCALVHVNALITMLNNGLDVKSIEQQFKV